MNDKKKAYQEYFKWVNAGFQNEAKQEFATLLKGGNTYLEYLKKMREDTTLTKEQIHQITTEIASETTDTIMSDFKNSLDQQMSNAQTVLEMYKIIEEKRNELAQTDNEDPLKAEKTEVLDKQEAETKKQEAKETEDLLKYLEKYKTFAKKRLDIEKQLQKDIADLKVTGASDDNIAEAQRQGQEALDALDLEIAKRDETFNVMVSRISQMGLQQLQQALQEAQNALAESEVTNGKDDGKTATLRAKIKKLEEEIKTVNAENEMDSKDETKKWNKTSKAIKKCKGEVDGMIDSMDFLDESTKEALQAASNIADGAIAMIDGIKALGIGAAQSLSAVEKASVILAIVGAAVQIVTAIFNMASKAEAEHQKALAEVAKNKLAMQREYNLALLEQNLLLKDAETIFGTDNYRQATSAINLYKESLTQLGKELKTEYQTVKIFGKSWQYAVSGLDSITVKTGHHKTGLFGWGKGEDEYTAITQLYDDLITKEGTLNIERAKAIVSTQTMSDENKEYLQYMIDLAEQAEKAFEQVKDYLTNIFGDLGNSMSDALTDAFRNGTDAAKAFSDSVSDMLAKLAQDMIYSVTLAPLMEQAQKDMLEVMKNGNLSDEQKFNQYAAIMSGLTQDAIKQKETADALYKKYQDIAAQNGIDIWKPDEDANTPTSLSGGIKGITQEQADILGGTANAMRVNQVESIEIMRNSLIQLTMINANTGKSSQHLESIDNKINATPTDPLRAQGITG